MGRRLGAASESPRRRGPLAAHARACGAARARVAWSFPFMASLPCPSEGRGSNNRPQTRVKNSYQIGNSQEQQPAPPARAIANRDDRGPTSAMQAASWAWATPGWGWETYLFIYAYIQYIYI